MSRRDHQSSVKIKFQNGDVTEIKRDGRQYVQMQVWKKLQTSEFITKTCERIVMMN